MNYLMGIDLGTSACKLALFREDGSVARQAARAYPVLYPRPGWAEQDPEVWWEAVVDAICELLADGQIAPGEVAGIGVDGQSWSAIPVDGQGQVLHNTPIWMDTRAGEECAWALERVDGRALFELSGNPLQPAYTLPKILWYQRHAPQVYQRCDKILQSNSFIVYRLTGALTQDLSQGYGLQCFDMLRGRWDETMARALGIDPGLLPELAACHQVVGGVSRQAARRTGLIEGTPVVAGGLDAACGTLGAGVIHPGETQEQGGQAGGMSICLDRMCADERLILGRHVTPEKWLLQGGTVGGGGVLKWLSEQCCAADAERAQAVGRGVFEEMSERAGAVSPGSEGVVFLPYMAGERSPIWDPQAKGVFYGLDFSKTRAHMIRAAMEGVAYSLRHNLEVAAQAGARVEALHAMGGAANSPVWTQIKADVTGCEIAVPASDTATTLGAALLAGVGTGMYAGFEEAVAATVSIRRRYSPNRANAPVYDQGYATYRELYRSLQHIMRGN